jgi:8-oxo-dGTP pyrophosphatase MutT (NUDIX family)
MYETSDGCLKVTAMRELFEETGVLLLEDGDRRATPAATLQLRHAVHTDPSQFQITVERHLEASVRWSSLRHFCTFITPSFEKRKYTTMFFLAAASDEDCLDMHADGHETASLCWVDPEEALRRNAEGGMGFMPPQFYVLRELAAHRSMQSVLDSYRPITSTAVFSADTVSEAVDCRGFPAMQPVLLPISAVAPLDCAPGAIADSPPSSVVCSVLALPLDEAYPAKPGRAGGRHRIYYPTPEKPPPLTGFVLERNV